MKKITEYIKLDYYKKLYLESLKEYFGEILSNTIIESVNKYEFNDFILENLNTHDLNKLKEKIFKLFGSKYELDTKYANTKAESFWLVSSIGISKEIEFKNLIEFFGYYISKIDMEMEDGELKEYIYICPHYSKNVDKMVYKENDGILYHFTSNKYADEILTKGLRCKSAKYRNYPKRIYLYSSNKGLEGTENFIKKVVNPFDLKRYGLKIFKIDLKKLKDSTIRFYNDESMEDKEAVFTYNNIPPQCIEKVFD